jgi:hypothetical protein
VGATFFVYGLLHAYQWAYGNEAGSDLRIRILIEVKTIRIVVFTLFRMYAYA